MNEERLNSSDRLNGSAKFVGTALKRGYKLSFTHTNKDGFGVSDIVEANPDEYVIGCLFEIPADLLEKLDKVEGVKAKAYKRVNMPVLKITENEPLDSSSSTDVLTYVVIDKEEQPKTTVEYANHILKGIIDHKMGEAYFEMTKNAIIGNNPDIEKDLLKYH
jgi:gamma-glutamylcyclotransferase (GGCT)/AIG2-like uncharacterized protein YtfP